MRDSDNLCHCGKHSEIGASVDNYYKYYCFSCYEQMLDTHKEVGCGVCSEMFESKEFEGGERDCICTACDNTRKRKK